MLARLEERGKELRQLSQEQGRVVQPRASNTDEGGGTGHRSQCLREWRREGLKHTPSLPHCAVSC